MLSSSSVLRPFFRHYGSKWILSGRLDAPQHAVIVEPLAGAAGYSCRYGADQEVRLFDIDEGVVSIWQWLIAAERADVIDLPSELGTQDIRTLAVPRPAMLLIQRWLTMQGSTANYTFPPTAHRWMERNPCSYWTAQIKQRIADQLGAIRGWSVTQASYEAAPDIEATWSIDPEYQSNRRGRTAYGKQAALDYSRLAEWCRTRRGQVFVHEQEGAQWLPFKVFVSSARTGRIDESKVKRCCEVLWTNQEIP